MSLNKPTRDPVSAQGGDCLQRAISHWIHVERLRFQIALNDLDCIEGAMRNHLLSAEQGIVGLLHLGFTPPGSRGEVANELA